MVSKVLLSLSLTVPPIGAPVQLEIGRLELELDFLREGARAPAEGFLVPRGTMGRLIADAQEAERDCAERVSAIRATIDHEILQLAEAQEQQLSGYVQRIDSLEQLNAAQAEEARVLARDLGRWQIGSYIIGGALGSALVWALVR